MHWDVCQVTKDHIKLATLLPEKVIMSITKIVFLREASKEYIIYVLFSHPIIIISKAFS